MSPVTVPRISSSIPSFHFLLLVSTARLSVRTVNTETRLTPGPLRGLAWAKHQALKFPRFVSFTGRCGGFEAIDFRTETSLKPCTPYFFVTICHGTFGLRTHSVTMGFLQDGCRPCKATADGTGEQCLEGSQMCVSTVSFILISKREYAVGQRTARGRTKASWMSRKASEW